MTAIFQRFFAAVLFAAVLAPQAASAQRMTGEARTKAIALMIKGCLKEAGGEEKISGVSVAAFCECNAAKVVDRATVKDFDDEDSPRMNAIIDESGKACLAQLGGKKE